MLVVYTLYLVRLELSGDIRIRGATSDSGVGVDQWSALCGGCLMAGGACRDGGARGRHARRGRRSN